MKKFTWIFGLALLWGGLNAVAQTVREVGDFEELKTEIGKVVKISTTKEAYDKAKTLKESFSEEDKYNSGESTVDDKTKPLPDNIIYQNLYDFYWDQSDERKDETEPVICYGFQGTIKNATIIFVTKTLKETADNGLPTNIYWSEKELNPSTLYYSDEEGEENYYSYWEDNSLTGKNNSGKTQTFTSIRNYKLYYRKRDDNGNLISTNASDNLSFDDVPSAFTTIWNSLDLPLYVQKPNYTTEYQAAMTAEKNARQAWVDATNAVTYTGIKVSKAFTHEISETDIEALGGNTYFWKEWPTDYTLNANGSVIYGLEATYSLFNTNSGTIRNLATPDGHIANNNPGTANLCLTYWNNQYRVYDATGEALEEQKSPEDAVYLLRSNKNFLFGCDMGDNKKIKPSESDYKVYQAQYANATYKDIYTFKLNIRSNGVLEYDEDAFVGKFHTANIDRQNTILYIDNADAKEMVKDMKNVAVMESNVYYCYNTVLEEGTDVAEFYIPLNFTSKSLTYNRDFNQKISAVCLPFTLKEDFISGLDMKTYQFSNIDKDQVMWFTEWGKGNANTPYLISLPENKRGKIFNLPNTSLQFVATPEKLLTEIGDVDFCGTYAYAYTTKLIGNNDYAVYGINDGWLVKTSKNPEKPDRLKQFRSYVYCKDISAAAGAPELKIGLMDEDGNEITAIETISGEIVSGFKAKGGDNVIEITTDEACQVKVYALNGALVKSTRVEAGTTSLPVKAGVYVVNGTKVIVK